MDPEMVEAMNQIIKDLDPIQLDINDRSKKAYIGCKLQELGKLSQFLKTNAFAFSHADMLGILNKTTTHKLKVGTFHPLVRQVRH